MRFLFFRLCILVVVPFLGCGSEFVLVTSLYNEVNVQRQQEYLECLIRNLQHPNIAHIHVFYDESKDGQGENTILSVLKSNTITISYINKRPTFQEIFTYVNTAFPERRLIIANADIYFDDTLHRLSTFDLTHHFIALTRWEVQSNGELENHPFYYQGAPTFHSQDTWIFQTPIALFDTRNTSIGIAYCDSDIAYLAAVAGYKVCNPCLSIVSHHLHVSGLRHWIWPEYRKPLLGILWSTLENITYAPIPLSPLKRKNRGKI